MGTELDSILKRVEKADAAVAKQLRTYLARNQQREFGLVFKRHLPERVTLPGRPISPGDKVAVLASRGQTALAIPDDGNWTLQRRAGDQSLLRHHETGEIASVPSADVVYASDFNDPIYPGLRSLVSICNNSSDQPTHTVINGENFHALQALRYTHAGKVDLIYIDPPYNTGNRDWIYNDRHINPDDGDRHSKWLAFMERRLLIAQQLLKETGVIIVAIGDDEHHRLRVLLDQIFGAGNFLANIVWQGGASALAKYTGGGIDYMLIYARNESALASEGVRFLERKPGLDLALKAATDAWEESDRDPDVATRLYRAALRKLKGRLEPAVFRYDQIDDLGRPFQPGDLANGVPRPNLQYDLVHPVTGKPVGMHPNGWRHTKERMQANIAAGLVLFGPDETTTARFKRLLAEQDEQVPYPSFSQARMPGTKRLEEALGEKRFPFPKDYTVLMRWFRMVAPSDAVVLDFFAGSASTGEAVMRLNAEDGGTRQAILVTNNELSDADARKLSKQRYRAGDPEWETRGVFEYVTRPRLEAVVTGTRPDGTVYSDGLPANVEFFNLTYENPMLIELDLAFGRVAPLLWLAAGGTGSRINEQNPQGWAVADRYAVVFDPDKAVGLVDELSGQDAEHPGVGMVFIVADDQAQFQAVARQLPEYIRTQRLYSSYLHSFTINTGHQAN